MAARRKLRQPLEKKMDYIHPSERDCYFQTVHAVFNMMDTHAAFASIQCAPSNVDELHLNVANNQNQIAVFCSVWLDHENNVAQFEPVGTVPQFQKQGLAAALLAYACNRLREMNCPPAGVENEMYVDQGAQHYTYWVPNFERYLKWLVKGW